MISLSTAPLGSRRAALSQTITAIVIGRTFIKFALIGCTGVVVNSTVLFLLHGILALPLLLATPVAVETAVLNNFFWNNRWTFRSRRAPALHALLKYNASCLAGLLICTTTLQVLVTFADVHYLAANLVGIGFSTSSNFLLSTRWAWRSSWKN